MKLSAQMQADTCILPKQSIPEGCSSRQGTECTLTGLSCQHTSPPHTVLPETGHKNAPLQTNGCEDRNKASISRSGNNASTNQYTRSKMKNAFLHAPVQFAHETPAMDEDPLELLSNLPSAQMQFAKRALPLCTLSGLTMSRLNNSL